MRSSSVPTDPSASSARAWSVPAKDRPIASSRWSNLSRDTVALLPQFLTGCLGRASPNAAADRQGPALAGHPERDGQDDGHAESGNGRAAHQVEDDVADRVVFLMKMRPP